MPLTGIVLHPGDPTIWCGNESYVSQEIYVTTEAEDKIDVVSKWIDYHYTTEGLRYKYYGIEGESYTLDSSGEVTYTDAVLNDPNGPVSYTHLDVYKRQVLLFQNLLRKASSRIPYGKLQFFLTVTRIKGLYGNGDCQGGACLRMLNTVLHKGKQRHRNAVHARTFAAQLEFQVDFVSQAVAELHIVLYRFQLIPNRDKGFCIRKSMRDVLGSA